MANILVCDDDRDILTAIGIYLKKENYIVYTAENGKEALDILKKNDIQLILMDIMMPEMDGVTAVVHIREFSNVPVIFLSAKGEETDKVLGLNVGADDYISKPFNPAELMARVRSQLRRYTELGSSSEGRNILRAGTIEMDNTMKIVTRDGEEIVLTPTEYEILKMLLEHPGQVFSPREIYRNVWNDDPYGAENTVAVHIRHLREKLEYDPANPRYLKVVWGQGYKLEAKKT